MASGVATVWVPVTDMARAVEFYGDTLGLTVKDHPVITFQPDSTIDDEVSRLTEAGVKFTGAISDHPWGRIAPFKDSEGNDLQFYAPPA